MLLQEASNARKTQINCMIKSLKDKALEKRKEVEQFNQKSMEVQAQVADVKSQVQTNVLECGPNDCNRPIRLTQCCTQFKSPGDKILCVLHLHYNVAFTFK